MPRSYDLAGNAETVASREFWTKTLTPASQMTCSPKLVSTGVSL